ncbi:MAG: GDSL-type esterase/lipase family protein [Spirochaetaceae bacterium]|jgi:lysophospholipase L1-like esterase|nr:GDSL-type esterase/lipase family protein [Spirochaetaceae bacterium]
MKKDKLVLISIILWAMIGLAMIGCNPENADSENVSSEGTALVCFGDSLTAGYGATVPGEDDPEQSYPAYLQEMVSMPVVNAGVSGDTTGEALARIKGDVLDKNPRIVIIELGANDLFQAVSPATTKKNLQRIISELNDGKRKLYLAKFYTGEVAQDMMADFGITSSYAQSALIAQYDAIFNALASDRVELIEDIWTGVWRQYMSDEAHPNAQGYKIMAETYFKALKPYLEANNLAKALRNSDAVL